jgi:tryptophan halogenase
MESIIVLGGGSSGLLSALMIKKAFPNFNVTVIKSDKIGIIGVGEGSTEHWKAVCEFLEIDVNDAVKYCGATMKVGIHFKNWGVPDYYHSVIDDYLMTNGESFPFYQKLIADEVDMLTVTGIGFKEPSVAESWTESKTEPEAAQFHFNAILLNEYLLKLCKVRNITIIEDEITEVQVENNKITNLIGKQDYSADFFIDATGMARVLIKELGGNWISYGDQLITNSAIAFPTEDTDEYPIYTSATAMDYGWMWNTPVQGRWGNGYVFCDKYIDFDQAQAEVEAKLGRPVKIFKKFKFDPGRLDKNWIGNCCAIGLSSGFVEPLESSAISQGLLQTWLFINLYPGWQTDISVSEIYNDKSKEMSENILDFIAIHYVTPREDTEFWKYLKNNRDEWLPKTLQQNLERWRHRLPYRFEFDPKWTLFKAENWIITLYGLQLLDIDSIKTEYQLTPDHVKEFVNYRLEENLSIVNSIKRIPHKKGLELFLRNNND